MAEDRVAVEGATGRPRPATLKVSLGYRDGYIGEGQISYAGAGAVARGRLAASIVAERLRLTGAPVEGVRCDLIGVDSLHGPRLAAGHEPYEVRLRVTARADSLEAARRIGQEVETLYTNGPAGGGGAVAATRDILAVVTTFVPRELVPRQHACRGGGMRLRDIAHSRTGDKGSTVNISLIPFDERDYPRLVRARHRRSACSRHFAELIAGDVVRYEIPSIGALNFVLHGVVGGGVTRTQALDAHGKSLSSALLEMEIPDDVGVAPSRLPGDCCSRQLCQPQRK